MAKLTEAQKRMLRGLHEQPDRFSRIGISNATMRALKNRRLACISATKAAGNKWHDFKWEITPAGRAAIRGEK